jgi:hypothetical protein
VHLHTSKQQSMGYDYFWILQTKFVRIEKAIFYS